MRILMVPWMRRTSQKRCEWMRHARRVRRGAKGCLEAVARLCDPGARHLWADLKMRSPKAAAKGPTWLSIPVLAQLAVRSGERWWTRSRRVGPAPTASSSKKSRLDESSRPTSDADPEPDVHLLDRAIQCGIPTKQEPRKEQQLRPFESQSIKGRKEENGSQKAGSGGPFFAHGVALLLCSTCNRLFTIWQLPRIFPVAPLASCVESLGPVTSRVFFASTFISTTSITVPHTHTHFIHLYFRKHVSL